MLNTLSPSDSISQALAEDLPKVEAIFKLELASDLPCVVDLVQHVEQYRGKMLRPMLVLAAARVADAEVGQVGDAGVGDRLHTLGAVVEMVHMATLVHDDVLDEAEIRRQGRTVNHLEGNETAVMLGDYLISHAYHLCCTTGDAGLAQRIAEATNTVCEGEMLQLVNRANWELDEPTYFEIIRRKTAALCGACCEVGARIAGASDELAEALYVYGEHVGVAFQVIDDVLDLTGDEETVGKSLGRDLDKGKMTLPVIHCLQTLGEADQGVFLHHLRQRAAGRSTSTDVFLRSIESTESLGYALTRAREHVGLAESALQAAPAGPARDHLAFLAEQVVKRRR